MRIEWIYRRLSVILKLLVTGASLYLAAKSLSLQSTTQLLAEVDFKWILAALVGFWASQFVAALRYRYIFDAMDLSIPYRDALALHFVGLWCNQILPTAIGGDAIKVLLLKGRFGLKQAVIATVLDRASGLLFLLMSIVLLIPVYLAVLPSPAFVLATGGFSAIALIGVGLLSWSTTWTRSGLFRIPAIQPFLDLFQNIYKFRRGRPLYRQIWTSSVVHLNGIATFALAGAALRIELPLALYFLITPLVFAIALIPVSFAGWGVRELGAISLFGAVGVPPDKAMLLSVLFGVILVVASLPGFAITIMTRHRSGHGSSDRMR